MSRFILSLTVFLLMLLQAQAQLPVFKPASQLLQDIKKLKVLGSVLYIAAHPDDENTRLISWLSNEKLYRTGYLSLTRGDGGQNLIGIEQGVELGLIRTQELLAARRIDGGEQFFTRAYDFGFSKNPAETFGIWDKDTVLSDVVSIIRRFQPDVIIARFPEDSRAGHGHHSASGIMARLGYEAAGDPARFPEQLSDGLTIWQPRRVLWNTFNFGSGNTIDSARQASVEVGQYLPLLGKSVGELAGESRSQHKSQGFGVSRQRGSSREFFALVKGAPMTGDILDGVNTTWSRVSGGAEVEAMIDQVISAFRPEKPSAVVPALARIAAKLKTLPASNTWVTQKKKEVEQLMLQCTGVYAEAVTAQPALLNGDTVTVMLNIINRSDIPVELTAVEVEGQSRMVNRTLGNNQLQQVQLPVSFQRQLMTTQPYWLRKPQQKGSFSVTDKSEIGQPENAPVSVMLSLKMEGYAFQTAQPVRYRTVDPVKAELYQPVHITEPWLIAVQPTVLLLRQDRKDSAMVDVQVTSQKKISTARPVIQLSGEKSGFRGQWPQVSASFNPSDKKTFSIRIPNYMNKTGREQDLLRVSFTPEAGGQTFGYGRSQIEYDHIPTQTWHYENTIKVLHIDLKTRGSKIGYLPGAGDKLPEALQQMGYSVTVLQESDLTLAVLSRFDAVITGVRAFNIHEYLAGAYDDLMAYVKNGGNLIVQYNTNNFISSLKGRMAPYPMNIGRTRITDEQSAVRFLLPDHPVLNVPNKISAADFEGWVQERSIYHAEGLDNSLWQLPLGLTDPGEQEQNGSLAIAPFGKGNFVYTGLVFFRQLPAGVPGAYRLLANLIGLPRR